MSNSRRFWRGLFFVSLIAAFCGGLALPFADAPARAAPKMQVPCTDPIFAQWSFAGQTTDPLTGGGVFDWGPGLPLIEGYVTGSGGTDWAVSFDNWTTASSRDTSDYIELAVPTAGRNFTNLSFQYQATSIGPLNLEVHYSPDGTSFTQLLPTATLTRDSVFYPLSFDFSSITGLDNNPNVTIRIYAYGATDALGTLALDNITFTGNCLVPPLTVILNEVAWAGTDTDPNDEWIELYNPSSTAMIDLAGWVLRLDNQDILLDSISIPPGGYFVLVRHAGTFVDGVPPAIIFDYADGFALSNNPNGEVITLFGPDDEIVDTANQNGNDWPAGIANPTYASMERRTGTADIDTAWKTFAGVPFAHDRGSIPVQGTPGQANWVTTLVPTIITITTTPNPSLPDTNVTVNVTVAGGTTPPTGTVTVSSAGATATGCSSITLDAATGAGSCTLRFTTPGAKTIDASYSGDGTHDESTGTGSHTVTNPAATTIAITTSPNPSLVNQNLTVSVTVTGGSSTPTGTVNISSTGATAVTTCTGIALSAAGAASCTLRYSSVGSKTITVSYSGDSTHSASNTTASHQVTNPTATAKPTATKVRTATLPPPPPPPLIAINEFVPRPGHDWNLDGVVNTDDEYIELLNHGVIDVNLSGYSLDDEANIGSNPFRLPSVVMKPGDRRVFFGSETGLHLSDGGDGVRLLKPNGQLGDAYNYFVVRFPDQSYCRLPDNGGLDDWNQNCFPTPGLQNSQSASSVNPPTSGGAETLCPIADTLPEDFIFAECVPFGANIWNPAYWDRFGWFHEMYLPESSGKWPVFVD